MYQVNETRARRGPRPGLAQGWKKVRPRAAGQNGPTEQAAARRTGPGGFAFVEGEPASCRV